MLTIKLIQKLHTSFKSLISNKNFSCVSVKLNPIENIDLSLMQNNFLEFSR